jgi:hypothetical protein
MEEKPQVNNNSLEKDYEWRNEQENILKKWADRSLCFKIMHERSYKKYWCLNAWFNIPVIIIATITGSGTFAVSNNNNYMNTPIILVIIGCINICAGILTAIINYMNIGRKMESHKIAGVEWNKFCRKIIIELDKPRPQRINVTKFIIQINNEYDHLFENYPSIPDDIIKWFHISWGNPKFTNTQNEFTECIYDNCCFPCGCNIFSCFNNNLNNNNNKLCVCPICIESKTYINSVPYQMV